jgi:hypothetical protein
MSAAVANTFLKQVKAIHTDMNSVTFFTENEECSKLLKELDEKLTAFEQNVEAGRVLGNSFVTEFSIILKSLVALYEKSYGNLEKLYLVGHRMKNIRALIYELTDIADHFSLMKVADTYSHINTIDSLFKSVSVEPRNTKV